MAFALARASAVAVSLLAFDSGDISDFASLVPTTGTPLEKH